MPKTHDFLVDSWCGKSTLLGPVGLFWTHVKILKLTKNMRLLAQSELMAPADRLKAESFAEWLLTIGDGRDNTIPMMELPPGIWTIKFHIH